MPFTVAFVVHEKEGISREDALAHWRGPHADLAKKIPNVRRYTQLHGVATPEGPIPFLGIATLEFDDAAAFEQAAGDPSFAEVMADVDNFASAENLPTAFVEPVSII